MTGRAAPRNPGLLLALLSAIVAAPGLANGFVYDDVAVIAQNPSVHSLSHSLQIWVSSYWPTGLLYRPLTIQAFAFEWWLGGGAPWVFHLANLLLMAGVTLLVYRVARRLLSAPGALVAGALFAVHPVHTEVVANAVGQSELLAALFTLTAVERYLVWRGQGPLEARHRVGLALLYGLAIASKETGYVLPAILLATEVLVVPRSRAGRGRLREAGPAFGMLACTAAIGLLVRAILFSGLKGETTAVSLMESGPVERAITMLGAVPQWFRLLVWPSHLQAYYGPPELPVGTTPGPPQVLGLLLLVGSTAALVWAWRRAPAVALGIVWIGAALAPVSNLLTATGILIAERTLFLPSVGFVLGIGWCAEALGERVAEARGLAGVLRAGFAVLLAAAALRSMARASAWRSPDRFFRSLERDAARTYRAHFSAAGWYLVLDSLAPAERAFQSAIDLYHGDSRVYEEYGQLYRRQKRCDRAVAIFREGLQHNPDAPVLRARLIECSLALGDTAGARELAREGIGRGLSEFEWTLKRISP